MPICGIEYAHVYADQQFSGEQLESIRELKKYELSITEIDVVSRRIILVDDYSPPKSAQNLDIDTFLLALSKHGGAPDVVVAESVLVPYCHRVICIINDKKLKRSILRYIETSGKFPCSLFIAAWYLLRLGVFGKPEIQTLQGDVDDLFTDTLVAILPDKFAEYERKALSIIEKTQFFHLRNSIRFQFFQFLDKAHESNSSCDWFEINQVNQVFSRQQLLFDNKSPVGTTATTTIAANFKIERFYGF